MRKIKISELPEHTNFEGLYTIGTNSKNQSVKVSLEFVQQAATAANAAAQEAQVIAEEAKIAAENAEKATKTANNAAINANTKANAATKATNAANAAATNANTKANAATKATNAANAAATNANDKANAATEATNAANAAATNANDKANAATEATNAANAATEAAHTAIVKIQVETQRVEQVIANMNTTINEITTHPFVNEQMMYGIEYDITDPSSACTRIGNIRLHATLPIQNRMRGCYLNDNGQVVDYLPADTWEHSDRSGSIGQVMIEIPEFYIKFESSGVIRRVKISEFALPDFHKVSKRYIGAYEATIERSTNKLCSVVNFSPDYRGGNNIASYDDTPKSLLGKPATKKTLAQFREAARNRTPTNNPAGLWLWNCLDYETYKYITWLYVIEYANRNIQLPFSPPDPNGFKQGGLGVGVTTIEYNTWLAHNGGNPIIECGISDRHGNRSDVRTDANITLPNGTIQTVQISRYRGIENPFGHIWKVLDGVWLTVENNRQRKIKCCENSKYYDAPAGKTNYITDLPLDGFVKEIAFGDFGDIIPKRVGGNSVSYFSDFLYSNNVAAGTTRSVAVGGWLNNGDRCGLFAFTTNLNASSGLGTRLLYRTSINDYEP